RAGGQDHLQGRGGGLRSVARAGRRAGRASLSPRAARPLSVLSFLAEAPTLVSLLVLGVVHGVSEFLPISSGGHLVLAQELLHFAGPRRAVGVALHRGTLAAVLVIFRRDLGAVLTRALRGDWRELGLLVLGTLPAVVVGLGFKHAIEELFDSARAAALGLIVTAAFLWAGERARRRRGGAGGAAAASLGRPGPPVGGRVPGAGDPAGRVALGDDHRDRAGARDREQRGRALLVPALGSGRGRSGRAGGTGPRARGRLRPRARAGRARDLPGRRVRAALPAL